MLKKIITNLIVSFSVICSSQFIAFADDFSNNSDYDVIFIGDKEMNYPRASLNCPLDSCPEGQAFRLGYLKNLAAITISNTVVYNYLVYLDFSHIPGSHFHLCFFQQLTHNTRRSRIRLPIVVS